jgi:transcriptional regulator with XRE-family HTH domain
LSSSCPQIAHPHRDADHHDMRRSQVRAGLQALGKKIEQLRVAKGWNRTTLAQKSGVTITTLRGLETATKVTQPEKLRAVATALGVSVKRLETDDTTDPRVRAFFRREAEAAAA